MAAQHVVEAHRAPRVRVHVRDLPLQLVGRGPEVVSVEARDVVPARPREQLGEERVAAVAEVALGEDRADQLGVRVRVTLDHGAGAVGRGIVADEQLERHAALLEHALQRAGDVALVHVRRDENADLRFRHPQTLGGKASLRGLCCDAVASQAPPRRAEISVAIATRDRPQALARCLESLRALAGAPARGRRRRSERGAGVAPCGGARRRPAAPHALGGRRRARPRRRAGDGLSPRRRGPGRGPRRRLRRRPGLDRGDRACLRRGSGAGAGLRAGRAASGRRRSRWPRAAGARGGAFAGARCRGRSAAATTSRSGASGSTASGAATSASAPARRAEAGSTWTSSTGSCARAARRSTSPRRWSGTSARRRRPGSRAAAPTASAWGPSARSTCAGATSTRSACSAGGSRCACASSPRVSCGDGWACCARRRSCSRGTAGGLVHGMRVEARDG